MRGCFGGRVLLFAKKNASRTRSRGHGRAVKCRTSKGNETMRKKEECTIRQASCCNEVIRKGSSTKTPKGDGGLYHSDPPPEEQDEQEDFVGRHDVDKEPEARD
mmetsp:Transcript_13034/g.39389  ORF Transcript_13034/g.39389 Transcript_13034/m.39389 type:complete len:104 (-) Transcript_13034:133-444(-)